MHSEVKVQTSLRAAVLLGSELLAPHGQGSGFSIQNCK